MYCGAVPEEFFIDWPYNPDYERKPRQLVLQKIDGHGEYIEVSTGVADLFELQLLDDTNLLFTNKSDQSLLFVIPLKAGAYRFLKSSFPYVDLYVGNEARYLKRRWLTRNEDLYRSLYELYIRQTIGEVTIYYYGGSLYDRAMAVPESDKADEALEIFLKMGLLSRPK